MCMTWRSLGRRPITAKNRLAPASSLFSLLLPYVRPYRWRVAGATASLLVAAGLVLGLGQGVRHLIDAGFAGRSPASLNFAALLMFVVVAALGAATAARFYLISWLGERASADLRRDLFSHVISLEPSFFETAQTGDILSRMTADIAILQALIGSSISMWLRNALLMVGALVMLIATSPKLAAIVVVVVPLVVGPLILFGRRERKLSRVAQDRVGDLGAYAEETFSSLATVQAYTHEAIDRTLFSARVEKSVFALAPGAALLWDEAPGNFAYRFQKGDRDAVAAALEAAAEVVTIDLINNRVVPAPMEARAAVGSFGNTGFKLLVSGQGVHSIAQQLAKDIFRVPPAQMHVVAPDVGGGFGGKNFVYPEYVLVLFAARKLGRDVVWLSDRNEDFVSSAHGRDNRTRARLALDSTGRFLALDVSTVANLGAYMSTSGPGSSTNAPSTAMGGLYDIPAIFMDVRAAFTNTVPIDAYRGAGKPEANFIIERLVDLAAVQTGRDPVVLRRQNLIGSVPHRTALGMAIDTGNFRGNLDTALARVDFSSFGARRAEAATRGQLRGIGVACFLETARGAPGECAGLRFRVDGRVEILLGTQSNGQGHETSFPQIAADRLGLPIECFDVVQADTAQVPRGNGHGGARSLHQGGTALVKAIETTLAKARDIAGRLLQCDGALLNFVDGVFSLSDGRSVALTTLAQEPEGLDCIVDTDLDIFTFPNGCHVAEVEIDEETGHVQLLSYTAIDDFGRLINPMLTEGQIVGGLAQGIGQALHEHTAYDAESGQLLAASFMDYKLPMASDLPDFDIVFAGVPTQANPLGVKGSGQAGCIAAPQTIMNAVVNALGVPHLDMPATPERVWRAIQARGAGTLLAGHGTSVRERAG